MASNFTPRVLSGYRRLFRARKSLFTGDYRAMAESRLAIRSEFDKNKHVDTNNATHMEGLLAMVDEAEDMLLHGIVRGELNEEKNSYEVKIKAEHADSVTNTTMEPITSETASSSSDPADVVVETTNNCSKSS